MGPGRAEFDSAGRPGPAELDGAVVTTLLEEFGPERTRELCEVFASDAMAKLNALEAALEAGDALAVARFAHGLKSGSGFVGATGVHTLAEELERTARAHELAFARAHLDDLRQRVAAAAAALSRLALPRNPS